MDQKKMYRRIQKYPEAETVAYKTVVGAGIISFHDARVLCELSSFKLQRRARAQSTGCGTEVRRCS
jgi:hypothetical protein